MRNYSGQYRLRDSDVKLLGISQVVFEKTEWRPEPKAEYLALFEVTVDRADIDQSLDQCLHLWYTPGDDVNPYCQLCRGLITYHHSRQ